MDPAEEQTVETTKTTLATTEECEAFKRAIEYMKKQPPVSAKTAEPFDPAVDY
jgi:hypothetical protein